MKRKDHKLEQAIADSVSCMASAESFRRSATYIRDQVGYSETINAEAVRLVGLVGEKAAAMILAGVRSTKDLRGISE